MKVSIVILNWNNPEVIDVCLHTLKITEGVEYEVVVVDNNSAPPTPAKLQEWKDEGLIDVLVLERTNHMFFGNNIGVHAGDQSSEYVLLLNSDVAFLRPDWLTKVLAWMEGTAVYEPTVWGSKPTVPKGGVLDIVSVGWSHDASISGKIRPEGWCCMVRRSVWTDISPDFPWHYGLEEQLANAVRNGARCGVLFNYSTYLVHREGGSGSKHMTLLNNPRQPDLAGWFHGLLIEGLDFTLGPDEHSSYLQW